MLSKTLLIVENVRAKYSLAFFFSLLLVALTQIRFLNHICNYNDCGYFLANQELALKLGIKHIAVVPWWWFSDIVGSWWLKIYGSQGIWEAKAGGILFIAFAGAISAQTIFLIYKPTLNVILGIAFAGLCIVNEMINYISVPTLIYGIFGYFFINQTLYPTKRIYAIGSALFFSLLVFSRMPLIVGLFLPGFCLFMSKWLDRSQYLEYRKSYYTTYLAIAICFGLLACYLQYKGLLAGYLFPEAHSKDHTLFSLVSLLANQLIGKSLRIIFIGLLGFVFYWSAKNGWLSRSSVLFGIGSLFALNVLLAVLSFKIPAVKELTKTIWPDSFDLYLIAIAFLVAAFLLLKNEMSFPEAVLGVLAVSWPFLRTLGSAIGIYWGIALGFLICGVLIQWLIRVGCRYNCRRAILILCSIFVLIAGGRAIKGQIDLGSRNFVKSEKAELAKMDGILSSSQYLENVGPLIKELKNYVKKGDKILASPYIPMVYFLSETLPLGNHCCLEFLDSCQYRTRLEYMANSTPPKVIVRPKVDFEHPERQEEFFKWPNRSDFLEDFGSKWAAFNLIIMEMWKPRLVWSNEYFEIYTLDFTQERESGR